MKIFVTLLRNIGSMYSLERLPESESIDNQIGSPSFQKKLRQASDTASGDILEPQIRGAKQVPKRQALRGFFGQSAQTSFLDFKSKQTLCLIFRVSAEDRVRKVWDCPGLCEVALRGPAMKIVRRTKLKQRTIQPRTKYFTQMSRSRKI